MQNPKELTKLKSKLDLASNRDSLYDMEDAMHKEVTSTERGGRHSGGDIAQN